MLRAVTALILLACGLALAANTPGQGHFETVYSWTGVDYVFRDDGHRDALVRNRTYVPGHAVPYAFSVDPSTGRTFVSMPRFKYGIPATFATVSNTKSRSGEFLLEPYLGWDYHSRGGCEGLTSVYGTHIDECGRLWVVDSGTVPLNDKEGMVGRFQRICPAKVAVFDVHTDKLLKNFIIPDSLLRNKTILTNLEIEVIKRDNECKRTFAYVADTGSYGLIVYDFDKDDAWRVVANEMYPYPEYGYFDIKGVKFDFMQGILGLSLSPKSDGNDRYLYFNSLASGSQSYVKTSYLKKKEFFVKETSYGHDFEHREFHTHHHHRSFGQSGSEVFFEGGAMFFPSLHNMSLYCWNYHTEYKQQNIIEVARHENFYFISDLRVVNTPRVSYLYLLSSKFYKYFPGNPELTEPFFHIMRAPIRNLIAGTPCAVGEAAPASIGKGIGGTPPIGEGIGETVI